MGQNGGQTCGASRGGWIVAQLWLAMSAGLLGVSWTSLETRPRSITVGWASANTILGAAPAESADVTAGPGVTTPSASVARFSIWSLPIVAGVVDARFLHRVAVSRIGGLYGP